MRSGTRSYSQSNIFRIDVSERPAVITDVLTIQGGSGNYDPEGIAIAPDHTLWIASEGNADDSVPQPPREGRLQRQRARRDWPAAGDHRLPRGDRRRPAGHARLGLRGRRRAALSCLRHAGYRLVVAQQRGWDYTTPECEDLDDDAGGLNASGEPNRTRIWIYDPKTDAWDHIAWELAPKPANATWVGLSEITEVPGGDYILIERDNRTGDFAVLKTLVKIDRHAAADKLISNSEKAVYDLLPHLIATNGWITDKPEGVAVTSTGRTYVVTDNDGVDDWSGESWFFDLGRFWRLFP